MDVSGRQNKSEARGFASVIRALDRCVTIVATAVALSALVALFLAIGMEVVVRYFTTRSLRWSTELPNILFPWLVMGGIVLAAQRGAHISVTLVLDMLTPNAARLLLLVMQVCVSATFFYLAYVGIAVIEVTGGEVYPVTGIPARWAYLALIVGFVGVGVTAVTTFCEVLFSEEPRAVRGPVQREEV